MQVFADKYLEKGVAEFVGEWLGQAVEQGLGFPVKFDRKRLAKAFGAG